jgi:hypothetical protein
MSQARKTRRVGACLLLAGALLAGVAPFLPWADGFVPLPLFTWIQSADLAVIGEALLTTLLIVWGAPLTLAAIAGAVLLERVGAAGLGPRIVSLVLVALGGLLTLITGALFSSFNPSALEYGFYGALLGYGCALIGAILLPAMPATPELAASQS